MKISIDNRIAIGYIICMSEEKKQTKKLEAKMILKINVKKVETGYICEADNGDLPFEGRVHATRADALRDLDAAYGNDTWQGCTRRARGAAHYHYEIVTD